MNNVNSFYSSDELFEIGFKSIGREVLISRKASIYKPEFISIGDYVRVDDFCLLSGGNGISLGNFIHIGCYAALYGGSGIAMGDFSCLSARVTLYSEVDDFSGLSLTNPMIPDQFKPHYRRGKIVLEKHTIVGVNSTVLPNVVLSIGAAVGAHSFVTKNCDSWTIYGGVPAKPIKARSQDMLELENKFIESIKLKLT